MNHLSQIYAKNFAGNADDEFYTPAEFVQFLMDQLDLANKKIWLPFDSDKSEFTKYCKAHNLTYKNTSDDYKNHLRDEFDWCDTIISNPPFSLLSEIYNNLCRSSKSYILLAPMTAITRVSIFADIKDGKCFPYQVEATTGFIRPDGAIKKINTIILTNIKDLKLKRKRKSFRQLTDGVHCDPPYDNLINFNYTSSFINSPKKQGLVPITSLTSEYKDQFNLIKLITPYVKNKKLFQRVLVSKK